MNKVSYAVVMGASLWLSAWSVSAEDHACGPQSSMGRWVPDVFETPMSSNKAFFGRACVAHDMCYSQLGIDREFCDAEFARHLRIECDNAYPDWQDKPSKMACQMTASVFVATVRQLGEPYFAGSQQGAWMYEWSRRQQIPANYPMPTEQPSAPLPVPQGDVNAR